MKKVNNKKKVTVIALSVVSLIAGIYFLQNRNSNGMENTSQVTKNADVGVSAKQRAEDAEQREEEYKKQIEQLQQKMLEMQKAQSKR